MSTLTTPRRHGRRRSVAYVPSQLMTSLALEEVSPLLDARTQTRPLSARQVQQSPRRHRRRRDHSYATPRTSARLFGATTPVADSAFDPPPRRPWDVLGAPARVDDSGVKSQVHKAERHGGTLPRPMFVHTVAEDASMDVSSMDDVQNLTEIGHFAAVLPAGSRKSYGSAQALFMGKGGRSQRGREESAATILPTTSTKLGTPKRASSGRKRRDGKDRHKKSPRDASRDISPRVHGRDASRHHRHRHASPRDNARASDPETLERGRRARAVHREPHDRSQRSQSMTRRRRHRSKSRRRR